MTFTAQYHGDCADCGEDVQGHEVQYDGTDTLVHVECFVVGLRSARSAACPSCHFTLPASGVCGECS